MAVKKFTATNMSDLTAFKAFLDENKSGTFLENREIVLSEDNLELTIDGWIKLINDTDGTKSGELVIATTDSDYTADLWYRRYNTTSGYGRSYISEVILNKNGMIIKFLCDKTSSVPTQPVFGGLITVDNKDRTAVIIDRWVSGGDFNSSTWISRVNSGFRAFAKDALGEQGVELYAYYGAALTTLAPIIPASTDGSTTLPYAFTAVQTQIAATGLTSVVVGSDTYITNGYWYVKD